MGEATTAANYFSNHAFCTTAVQKWFFSSHFGTAPTKFTSKRALFYSRLFWERTTRRRMFISEGRHPGFPASALQKWLWSR
jgi:hypothetical protein